MDYGYKKPLLTSSYGVELSVPTKNQLKIAPLEKKTTAQRDCVIIQAKIYRLRKTQLLGHEFFFIAQKTTKSVIGDD